MVKHLLNQTVTLYGSPGLNDFGEFTFSSGTSAKGRFEEGGTVTFQREGEIVKADATFFTATACVIGGKINYNSVDYRIVDVKREVDGKGDTRFYQAILERLNA